MPPRLVENDENKPVRVNLPVEAPDDSDRMRFGFKRKGAGPGKLGTSASVTDITAPEIVQDAPVDGSIVFHDLVDRVFGDAEPLLLLMRRKPVAAQYMYKDKIAEQADHIQQLKAALAGQLRGREELSSVLSSVERDVTHRLQFAHQDVLTERREKEAMALELSQRRKQLEANEKQLRGSEQQAQSLREAAETAAEDEAKTRSEFDTLKKNLESVKFQLQESQSARQAAEEEAASERKLCQEQEQVVRETKEREEQRVAELMREVRESTEEAQEHRKQLHSKVQEQAAQLGVLTAARDELLKELAKTQADLEEQQKASEEISETHEALLRQVETSEVELKNQATELHSKDSQLREATSNLADRTQQLAEEESQNSDLRSRLNKAREHTDELRQQVAQGMRELNEERVQLSARDVELETLKAQLLEQESLCGAALKRESEMRLCLHKATKERDEEGGRLCDKEVELEALRVQLTEKEAAYSASHRREQSLKDAVAKQQALIEAIKVEFQEEGEAAAVRERDLEARLTELEATRAQESKGHKALELEHQKLKQLCDKWQSEAEAQHLRCDELEASLRDTMQRLDERGERLETLEATVREKMDQLRVEQDVSFNLRAELKAVRAIEAELRSCSTASAVEAAQMQAELSALRPQVNDLKHAVQKAEGENERLTESISEGQTALRECQEQFSQAKAKLSDVQSEVAATQASLAAKTEQAENLQREKRALEVECRSYREHRDSSNQQQLEAIKKLELTVHKLSEKVDSSQQELNMKEGSMMQQATYIKGLEDQLSKADAARRELHNAIQELKGNIRVLCRVRPSTDSANLPALREGGEMNKLALSLGPESHSFAFDKVFLPSEQQQDIFSEVSGVVQSALDGYKVSIFAYGQTGSGKTYTMQGMEEPEHWGLIPRSLHQIFEKAEQMRHNGWKWSLQASFIEVYNETLRDLLGNNSASSAPPAHVIKHDDRWGAIVTNVTCVEVDSLPQIKSLMARAARQRSVGATDMNSQSSRSHSVFALYLKGYNQVSRIELHGALHLVDLAGSERLDRSGSTGERLKETQNINKSLSSLADVFLAKAEGRSHVPFRNSKLTHLMEPCLSGQGKTVMVVNAGPEMASAQETLCSLRFAAQVSQCDTGGKPKRSAARPTTAPAGANGSGTPTSQLPARQSTAPAMTSSLSARRRR
mmetsp:Transcript_40788/g.93930  ORF Transcript_40788/g.93930 Transcript_40788/m.93930 type:complete len:1180 (-) Transcript_40788:101-3640(-)